MLVKLFTITLIYDYYLKFFFSLFNILYISIGVKTEKTIEELQAQRDSLKMSLKETRNHIEALQLRMNKHNERLHEARETYNKLHEEQLRIQSDMQKLKHLKDKQDDLYRREVTVGETVEKLREDLIDAENQLDSKAQQLEKIKVCF